MKQKASNKHVDFALCPRKKSESVSSSSKDGVRSSKQTKASPKKRGKPRSSPVKNRENQKVIQERVRNHKEDIVYNLHVHVHTIVFNYLYSVHAFII